MLFWAVLLPGSLNGAIALGNLNPSMQTLRADAPSVQAIEAARRRDGVLQAGDRIVAVDGHAGRRVTSAMRAIAAHRCAGRPEDGCRAATPVR